MYKINIKTMKQMFLMSWDDEDDYDSLMEETDDLLEDYELERQLAEQEEEAAYRAYREEQAAYDDFIASLDMAND